MVETLRHYRAECRFALHAFVVMPDHVHFLLTPAPDVSLEKAVQFIKGGFSFRLKGRRDVWERGHNEVQILSRDKFEARKRHNEENPVKAGLALAAAEYLHSSAHRPRKWIRSRNISRNKAAAKAAPLTACPYSVA